MPRANIHDTVGRPPKKIDWNLVDDLIEAGCPGTEIAPHFDMHPNTFYNHVVNKYGIDFTSYCGYFSKKGESNIRKKQYDKALKGDNMMLIWLGKNRLKQADQSSQEITVNDQVIATTLELAKLKAENSELKRILNESKTGTEHLSSEQASEYMVRSSPIGEDIQ